MDKRKRQKLIQGGVARVEQIPTPTASFIDTMVREYFLTSRFSVALTYFNFLFAYLLIVLWIAGFNLNVVFSISYLVVLYALHGWRKSEKEKIRMEISHRIPFFADALANILSIGTTLEHAFVQATFYLKGEIKKEFNKLVLKSAFGKDLGVLLREIDLKFPRTGLRYLISLLEQYRELGIGISPLLKRMAVALTEKEEAEEKVRSILATGSNYARLSIFVFGVLFFALSYLLKDQIDLLLSPSLKPILLFLLGWSFVGIILVSRITSMDFTRSVALRPQIKSYFQKRKLTHEEMYKYSGIEWTTLERRILYFIPLLVGFISAFVASWHSGMVLTLVVIFMLGVWLSRNLINFIVQGLLEDELIKTIETFPEILQVFIIGLNSGLNTYTAFHLAENAVKGTAPKVLTEELCRTKFAMECGENHDKTWKKLSEKLPFETVVDFCDIMVIAPMHGESIVKSIAQMVSSYQTKKLIVMEKKATLLGQLVIPLIVMAFFPTFLFIVFGPVLFKISALFNP